MAADDRQARSAAQDRAGRSAEPGERRDHPSPAGQVRSATPSPHSGEHDAATSYEKRVAELPEADSASLGMVVRRAVMLSMSLTGTLKHFDGSDAWTHDDYDVAMAALNELVERGVPADTEVERLKAERDRYRELWLSAYRREVARAR